MIQALDSFSLGFVEEKLRLQSWNHETSGIHSEKGLLFFAKDKKSLAWGRAEWRDFKNVVVTSTCDLGLVRAIDIGKSGFLL